MAWTQDEVDQLKAAILALATGQAVASVSYNGPPARTVQYQPQDLDKMRALLASMEQSVSAAAGGRAFRYAATSKGFGRC